MDFILALPKTKDGFDCAMGVTCKYSKRVTVVPGKSTWEAKDWADALLERLWLMDWGLPKRFISDRDSKFVSEFWKRLFTRLGVQMLYSTAWHPQTDGQSERSNQTLEIALRFYIATLDDATEWPRCLPQLTAALNNSKSAATQKTPNEVVYSFTPNFAIDPTDNQSDQGFHNPFPTAHAEVIDALDLAAMTDKLHYDRKHTAMFLAVGDKAYLRLHKGYNIPAASSKKIHQQYVGPFKVLARVGRLAYKLDIPAHWRVHPVFTIAQLEPAPHDQDPFTRPQPSQPSSVSVEGDTETYKSWEIERLLDKRTIRKGRGTSVQYLVRWTGYGPEFDQWYPLSQLENAKDLIAEYEARIQGVVPAIEIPNAIAVILEPRRKRGRPRKLVS
jgi:hypothetical protein